MISINLITVKYLMERHAVIIMRHIRYDSNLTCKRWLGYFDLLGMKRLHESKDPISIFIKHANAIEIFSERVAALKNIECFWFSDTFIVYTKDDSAKSFSDIHNIVFWCFPFLINREIPFRGAVSCDKFYSDKENNLFFGEALIEAYEYGEAQDWIGLILCPSSVEKLKSLVDDPNLRGISRYINNDIPYTAKRNKFKPIKNLPAYKADCSEGSATSILKSLQRMKTCIRNETIKKKYDRTIKFHEKNKIVLKLGSKDD